MIAFTNLLQREVIFVYDNRTLLLVYRSSSKLVERYFILTSQSYENFTIIAFAIKTQVRINDANNDMEQGFDPILQIH